MQPLQNLTHFSMHDLTGEEDKPLLHPDGDYSLLNSRLSHLEQLIESHCPEIQAQINLSFYKKGEVYALSIASFDDGPSHSCCFSQNSFFDNSEEHTKFLLYPIDSLIDYLEIKYLAHPLRTHPNIYYGKLLCTGETDYSEQRLIQVHGDFSESQAQIKQTFEMLNLLPYPFTLHIEYTESPHYNQYYFTATVKNPEYKTIAQTGTVTLFEADEVESFNQDAVVMDKYMAKVYQKLNKIILKCDEYVYYKAKLDLYNSLDEHITQIPNPDEDKSLKVKI